MLFGNSKNFEIKVTLMYLEVRKNNAIKNWKEKDWGGLNFLNMLNKLYCKTFERKKKPLTYLLSLLLLHPTSLWTNFFLLALCCSDKNPFRHPCIELKLYWGQLSQDLLGRPVARLLTQVSLTVIFLINPNRPLSSHKDCFKWSRYLNYYFNVL